MFILADVCCRKLMEGMFIVLVLWMYAIGAVMVLHWSCLVVCALGVVVFPTFVDNTAGGAAGHFRNCCLRNDPVSGDSMQFWHDANIHNSVKSLNFGHV